MHKYAVSRVEAQDGGDARRDVSPRDIIYSQAAEHLEAEEQGPAVLLELDFRFRQETLKIDTTHMSLYFHKKIK